MVEWIKCIESSTLNLSTAPKCLTKFLNEKIVLLPPFVYVLKPRTNTDILTHLSFWLEEYNLSVYCLFLYVYVNAHLNDWWHNEFVIQSVNITIEPLITSNILISLLMVQLSLVISFTLWWCTPKSINCVVNFLILTIDILTSVSRLPLHATNLIHWAIPSFTLP